eukprot:SAG22_NODE_177_length_16160_cov_41.299296_12_plen_137_part_00
MTRALAGAFCLLGRAPGRFSGAPPVLRRDSHLVRCQRFFAGDASAPSTDPSPVNSGDWGRKHQVSVLELAALEDLDPKLLKCKTGDEFARYASRNGASVHRGEKHVQVRGGYALGSEQDHKSGDGDVRQDGVRAQA